MKRMPGGWTAELDAVLLELFPTKGADAVAAATSRSYGAVQRRANRLGLHMNRRGKRPDGHALSDRLARAIADAGAEGFSPASFATLFPTDKLASLRTTLGRLVDAEQAFAVGHHAARRWFATVEAAMAYDRTGRPRTHRERLIAERAERALAREADRKTRATKRAENRAAAKEKHWTDAERRYLVKHYPTGGAKAVAPVLGRSVTAVTDKARKLGLKCEVCVQYVGYVKAPPKPKAPKPRPVAPVVLRPAASKASKPRGPALVDGPVRYHPDFKFTRVPPHPPALRTNTHSMY